MSAGAVTWLRYTGATYETLPPNATQRLRSLFLVLPLTILPPSACRLVESHPTKLQHNHSNMSHFPSLGQPSGPPEWDMILSASQKNNVRSMKCRRAFCILRQHIIIIIIPSLSLARFVAAYDDIIIY